MVRRSGPWRMMLGVGAIAGWLAAAAVPAGGTGQAGAAPQARVALTFDDLPSHGPLPGSLSRVDIAKSIIATLKKYNAPPTYGFINAVKLETTPAEREVLQLWRAAGFPLGNHGFTHMDLQQNTAEAFEKDVLANEPALRSLMGENNWHWFRYPYLHEGDTPEKYQAVRAMLGTHGYRVAQVTLDFNDYAYNDPYARCLARKDTETIGRLQQSYLDRAGERITRGQDAARALFGRDISHVMLLHIGGFETVMLPRLLDLLQTRGFALTTLEEAQRDEAYTTVPRRTGNWSGTLLEQLQGRGTPPPASASGDTLYEKLGTLCKA